MKKVVSIELSMQKYGNTTMCGHVVAGSWSGNAPSGMVVHRAPWLGGSQYRANRFRSIKRGAQDEPMSVRIDEGDNWHWLHLYGKLSLNTLPSDIIHNNFIKYSGLYIRSLLEQVTNLHDPLVSGTGFI